MCHLHLFRSLVVMISSMALLADEPKAGRVVLESKGYVVPASQVTVSPRVAGQVVELLIEEGKRVKAGEVLARLDPREQEAALQLARAELKLAEAELVKAIEAGTKADTLIGRAKVEAAQARVVLAQQHLEDTVIRAPITGTVLTKRAEVGNLISPNHPVSANLCDLADLRALEVEVSIQERDLGKIAKGQPCQIRLEAFPQTTYRGQVARLLPVADRSKGAVGIRVRVDVPEKDEQLRPEMGAIVTIMTKE
jgi:RND family efflux transporter MFP subunit